MKLNGDIESLFIKEKKCTKRHCGINMFLKPEECILIRVSRGEGTRGGFGLRILYTHPPTDWHLAENRTVN